MKSMIRILRFSVGKSEIFRKIWTPIMADQKKISSFFQPLANKRACQASNVPQSNDDHPTKKAKLSVDPADQENKPVEAAELSPPCSPKTNGVEAEGQTSPTSPLSPEQRKRIDENRRKAEMKVWEKKTHGLLTCVGDTWFTALKAEFSKPYFMKLAEFVAAERKKATIFPPSEQVFAWTQVCPIRQVKVVILGQDPYHGPKQAHGLCFSVQPGVASPPSLVNMYKELESDIDGFKKPTHGYLMGWAGQGVLLLNACLTVRAHQANSHKDQGWEKLTDAVISWINKNLDGVVFMLWGAYAQKKGACINKNKHHILKSVHPSPLSAHRGFLGCKHFSQCNELLKKQSKKPIDWTHLPLE